MSKYIGSEEKVVKAGEKLNFENLSKSPVTVGTAVMFNKDGVYICDVLNGKVRITCDDQTKAKHGEWQITDAFPHNVYCSECHKKIAQARWAVWEDGSLPRNYCPNCGADMRGNAE